MGALYILSKESINLFFSQEVNQNVSTCHCKLEQPKNEQTNGYIDGNKRQEGEEGYDDDQRENLGKEE